MFDNVVFGETIEVDSSTVPAEKNAGESQEISKRLCEIVYTLDCLDESVYCKIPAVTITDTGYSPSSTGGIKKSPHTCIHDLQVHSRQGKENAGQMNREEQTDAKWRWETCSTLRRLCRSRRQNALLVFLIDHHNGCTYP